MIAVVGYKGNMGSRYGAILDHSRVQWRGIDLDSKDYHAEEICKQADGIIIATPTSAHFSDLLKYRKYGKPILCEKPFTKNMNELEQIMALYKNQSLSMVLQYKELINQAERGHSIYDYFKHGSDGLVWDCIQIVGLAKNDVDLYETSPIWTCAINGQELSIGDMDIAYLTHVRSWLSGEQSDLEEIYDIHKKTSEYEHNH